MERSKPRQLTLNSHKIDILLVREVLVGKLWKPISPEGRLYNPDRVQVFRQLGIQISNVGSPLYMIVNELDERQL